MRKIELQGRVLTRRALLRGVLAGGAVSVGLPMLEYFLDRGQAHACGGVIPVRFGLFFWGNGNKPDRWLPSGEGETWELSPALEPLANVKSRIAVLTGLAIKTGNSEPHTSGSAGILTGAAPLVESDDTTFALASIDQRIAEAIGGDTLYRSLQTGVAPGTVGASYSAPWTRNPPELSPFAFYERVFGATFRAPGDSVAPDPSLGLRQSALDVVHADLQRLQGRVGKADRERLEQHMDGIRELEARLSRLQEDPPQLEACAAPSPPAAEYPDVDGRPC